MLGTHDLALFAATVFVLNATPGVDMAYAVASTLRGGWRQGVAAAAGIMAGCVLHTGAAAFGLAALLAASAEAVRRRQVRGGGLPALRGLGHGARGAEACAGSGPGRGTRVVVAHRAPGASSPTR